MSGSMSVRDSRIRLKQDSTVATRSAGIFKAFDPWEGSVTSRFPVEAGGAHSACSNGPISKPSKPVKLRSKPSPANPRSWVDRFSKSHSAKSPDLLSTNPYAIASAPDNLVLQAAMYFQ